MTTPAFELRYDLPAMLAGLKGIEKVTVRGAAVGLARVMENIRNRVSRSILGGEKWDGIQNGMNGGYHPKSYAMAVNIARREGYGDFKRKGSGWQRVKELVPRMAWKRPSGSQVLWIQSGMLRKTLSWGMRSISGNDGIQSPRVTIGKSLAVSFLSINRDYGGKHEYGRYPFAVPAVKRSLTSGEVTKTVNQSIREALAKHAKSK